MGDTADVIGDKKIARFFRKKIGVTPLVAARGDTNSSDATVKNY